MATIELNGKKYSASVRNGKHYIHGMSQDDFVDYLEKRGDWLAMVDLAKLGHKIIRESFTGSPQVFIKSEFQSRNN